MYALTNCKIFTSNDILIDHAVVIKDQLISAVCLRTELPHGIKIIDLNGANLSPGFMIFNSMAVAESCSMMR